MGLVGGATQAIGAGLSKRYLPYKPSGTKELEKYRLSDVRRTYGKEGGYEGPGLGFTDSEVQNMYGRGRDLAAGEYAGEQQRLYDRYRAPGGFGLRSGMFERAQQRMGSNRAATAAATRAEVEMRQALQKRADLYRRLASTSGAFLENVGLLNQRSAVQRNLTKEMWAGIGEFGDSALSMAATGGIAG